MIGVITTFGCVTMSSSDPTRLKISDQAIAFQRSAHGRCVDTSGLDLVRGRNELGWVSVVMMILLRLMMRIRVRVVCVRD